MAKVSNSDALQSEILAQTASNPPMPDLLERVSMASTADAQQLAIMAAAVDDAPPLIPKKNTRRYNTRSSVKGAASDDIDIP